MNNIMSQLNDITRSYMPTISVVGIIGCAISIGVLYGTLTTRMDSIQASQVTKEDIRAIVAENNEELSKNLQNSILLAVQDRLKKN